MARQAAVRARSGSYLKKRGNVFWLKLQAPTNIERSLGTRDKLEAERLALVAKNEKGELLIAAHKAALLAARPQLTTVWVHKLTPRPEVYMIDGAMVIAGDRELTYIENGVTRTEPNGGPELQASSVPRLGLNVPVNLGPVNPDYVERPTLAIKNSDDSLFETYLQHAKGGALTGHALQEALDTWAIFKALMNGKALKDCNRDDGRALAKHLAAGGIKGKRSSATVKKMVARLCAAVNLAIKDIRPIDPDKPNGPKWIANPFSGVAPVRKKGPDADVLKRKPFSPDDIAAIKGGLDALDESDRKLVRLLACTGLRLSEAFEIGRKVTVKVKVKVAGKWVEQEREQINGDMVEHGVRYVIVGHKTEASLRRVPLPAGVLADYPDAIKGPLFDGTPNEASKRLMKFIRGVGIDDPAKVAYSFRHLAKDKLRAAECPEDIAEAIFGRDETTVGDGYGKGYAVPQLKKWIDLIGF